MQFKIDSPAFVVREWAIGNYKNSVQSNSSNINVRGINGRTPMYLAIANGHYNIVRLFIEIGGDHKIKDWDGRRAAYWAGEREHWKVLRLEQLHEGRLARESGSQDPPWHLGVRDGQSLHWGSYHLKMGLMKLSDRSHISVSEY